MKSFIPLAALSALALAQSGPNNSGWSCYPGEYACDYDGGSWWVCNGESRWRVSLYRLNLHLNVF